MTYRNIITAILLIAAAQLNFLSAKEDDRADASRLRGADMTLYGLYADNLKDHKETAMGYATLFLSRIDSTQTDPLIAELYEEVADWYELDLYQYSKAITYREKAFAQYKALGDGYRTALCSYCLAKLYLKKGYYHLTLQYATDAAAYFEKHKDNPTELIECYKLLGIVYETCGDYEQSDRYFSEYAKAAKVINDSVRFMIGLNNTAAFASSIGDTAKTVRLMNECISICKEMGDTVRLCKIYLNAAGANTESGDYDKAEYYLNCAKPLLKNIELQGHYWLNKGNMMLKMRDTIHAIADFENSIKHYSQGEFDNILKGLYYDLNNLYGKLGDTSKAYHYLYSLYELENLSPENDVWRQLFKVQNEIQAEKTAKEKERYKQRQTIYLISSIFTIIVSALSIFIIMRKKRFEERQRYLEAKNYNDISEIKKTQQFRTDRIVEAAATKLSRLASETPNAALRSNIMAVCNELRDSKESDSWKELEQYVPDFNGEFFQKLIKDFPSLTVNESRICVLLNRNLSTKQISEITRQSPESINVARTRLRKKLGIDGQKVSLQEFLRKYNN